MRVEDENFRLPVDVRGSKTSVLKLSIVFHLTCEITRKTDERNTPSVLSFF